jgi:tetratricopeptide (TPR) repeat protein
MSYLSKFLVGAGLISLGLVAVTYWLNSETTNPQHLIQEKPKRNKFKKRTPQELYQRGRKYQQANQLDKAVICFNQVLNSLKKTPKDQLLLATYQTLFDIYCTQDLPTKVSFILKELTSLFSKTNNFSKGALLFEQLSDRIQDKTLGPLLKYQIAKFYLYLNNTAKAEQIFTNLVQDKPPDKTLFILFYKIGRLYFKAQIYDKAKQSWDICLNSNDESLISKTYNSLACLSFQTDKFSLSEDYYSKLQQLNVAPAPLTRSRYLVTRQVLIERIQPNGYRTKITVSLKNKREEGQPPLPLLDNNSVLVATFPEKEHQPIYLCVSPTVRKKTRIILPSPVYENTPPPSCSCINIDIFEDITLKYKLSQHKQYYNQSRSTLSSR